MVTDAVRLAAVQVVTILLYEFVLVFTAYTQTDSDQGCFAGNKSIAALKGHWSEMLGLGSGLAIDITNVRHVNKMKISKPHPRSANLTSR